MSEFKFDKLKNYEAPNEWAEKVIRTANAKKKENIYFTRYYRVAIICMCLILMFVMGFTVCLQIVDETIIMPVNEEETVNSTKNPHMDNINSNITYKDDVSDSDFETDIAEKDTESDNSTEKSEASEKKADKETQKVEPSKNKADKESQKVEPTKKKPEKETQKVDIVKPTKKPHVPDKPENETQKPPTKPESTTPVIEPTETPIEDIVKCSTTIDKKLLSKGDSVYCRIYDCDIDVYLGDENIYSSQHIAEFYGSSADSYYIRYFPVKKGVITKNGEYIVMFYDKNGRNLKTFGFTVKEF